MMHIIIAFLAGVAVGAEVTIWLWMFDLERSESEARLP